LKKGECVYLNIHFHMPLSKKKLTALQKKIGVDTFESACKKLSGSSVVVRGYFQHLKKEYVADFKVGSLSRKKGVDKTLRSVFRLIQDFVDKSKKLGCERYVVYSKIMFAYDKSQRFINIPHLPATMGKDPSGGKLGNWQLSSLGITFAKSRLGLSNVIMAYINDRQTLTVIAKMKVMQTSKFSERVFSKSQTIASFFLV
jgi:hypothetical protein